MVLKRLNSHRGIALILVLSILVLLSTFASFFSAKARAELIKANDYKNAAKAFYLAEAGLHRAIYELKFHPTSGHAAAAGAGIDAQDTRQEAWYFADGMAVPVETAATPSFSGSYGAPAGETERLDPQRRIKLKILDSASLINLNSNDTAGLKALLGNLLNGVLSAAEVDAVLNARSVYAGGFKRVEDIRVVVGTAKFDQVRPYLTVHSYIDPKLITQDPTNARRYNVVAPENRRAPVNVNTADVEVLKAILRLGTMGITNAEADALAANIIAHVATNPFRTWAEFDNFLDTNPQNAALSVAKKTIIKNAVNPNRDKNAGPPQEYTTDFTFASDGFFEIEALGEVTANLNRVVARRKVRAAVQIYNVFRVSTREDFVGQFNADGIADPDEDKDGIPNLLDSDLATSTDLLTTYGNGNKPGFWNTSWFDSVPINPADDQGINGFAASYDRIPGSIKLGYWDDFDEAPEESSQLWIVNVTEPILPYIQDVDPIYWDTAPKALDANDKELWYSYFDDPLDDTYTFNGTTIDSDYATQSADDFMTFELGRFYISGQPYLNTYRRWDGDFYFRIFNSEGKRAEANWQGVAPGLVSFDFPGRDYRDVGYVLFRYASNFGLPAMNMIALSTTGNYWDLESRYPGYDMNGDTLTTVAPVAVRDVRALPPATPPANATTQPYAFQNEQNAPPLPNPTNRNPTLFPNLNAIYFEGGSPYDLGPYFPAQIDQNVPFTGPIREKTYRLTLINNKMSAGISYQNASFEPLLSNVAIGDKPGSFGLFERFAHPAWDDIRIIGESGEYTTAAFSPGDFGANNENILWGTFSWTENTRDFGGGNIPRFQNISLLFAAGSPPSTNYTYPANYQVPFSNNGVGGPLLNTVAAPVAEPFEIVRLYARMRTDIVGDQQPAVPILEDATITYLKNTRVFYREER